MGEKPPRYFFVQAIAFKLILVKLLNYENLFQVGKWLLSWVKLDNKVSNFALGSP